MVSASPCRTNLGSCHSCINIDRLWLIYLVVLNNKYQAGLFDWLGTSNPVTSPEGV